MNGWANLMKAVDPSVTLINKKKSVIASRRVVSIAHRTLCLTMLQQEEEEEELSDRRLPPAG